MIKTERLVLRRAVQSDLDAFHEIMTIPDVMRFWSCPPHAEISQTQKFLDYLKDFDWAQREEYVVEYQGKCVGKAGCWRRPELGFILHPDVWGMGVAAEASAAIIPRAFKKFSSEDYIIADVDPRNKPSVAVLKKLGFSLHESKKKDFLYGGVEWCDTDYYRLPRPVTL